MTEHDSVWWSRMRKQPYVTPRGLGRVAQSGDLLTVRQVPFLSCGTPDKATFHSFCPVDESDVVVSAVRGMRGNIWCPNDSHVHGKIGTVLWDDDFTRMCSTPARIVFSDGRSMPLNRLGDRKFYVLATHV